MWRHLCQRWQRRRCHELRLQNAKILLKHQQQRHKCIAVAMSGGIDSSVAAMLLQEQGNRDLVGVFMTNWDSSDEAGEEICSISRDREHMREVCARLQIEAVDVSNDSSSSSSNGNGISVAHLYTSRSQTHTCLGPTVSFSAMETLFGIG